jgi:hypothetical protein
MFISFLPDIPLIPDVVDYPALSRMYVQVEAEKKDWKDKQWSCLDELIQRESEWKLKADNPNSSAFGLFQMLKTPSDTGLEEQTDRGLRYIERRYNEPCSALRHHNRRGWY